MHKEARKNRNGGETASRKCPSCHSNKIWKDGIRRTRNDSVQRYICRDCGYRFSESSVLSMKSNNSGSRQVCAVLTEAKNLTKVEPLKSGLAGATTKPSIKGLVVDFLWYLKKNNYAELTIKQYVKEIKLLRKRGANLLNPENVKKLIARQKWCNNRKVHVYWVYDGFLRMLGRSWEMPRTRIQHRMGFAPTEETLNQAIAGLGKRVSIICQLIKETGCRSGEAQSMK